MRKQRHRKTTAQRGPARARSPVFSDNPAHDDPHDAIDQELLGIWLSVSRLRHLLLARPPGSCIIPLREAASKKQRRKAA
jgi:hypothetical protein